ncbi:MAG: dipeptidase PepV [Mogibacterium sp.]|nr:dipeptidase PepV [Mogibacterium sp.]
MGYLERLETYREDMLKTLGESVAFPSVASEAVRSADGELMPFGKAAHESLLHMLAVGEGMGFETCNVDNYAGYIQYSAPADAEDAKLCAVVGHLDVVPEGTGWTGEPYKMVEKDGFVYGRGTADDKGPVIASLYAMKALKEEGIVPKNHIRLVLGLNEECGEDSMVYYTEKCGHPDMGFTPDAEFPIVNGEMGILVFELAQKLGTGFSKDDLRLTKLEGGTAHNAVPRLAKAVLAGDKKYYDTIIERARQYAVETGYNLKARKQGSSLVIDAEGIAAHGAHPHLGLNAVSILMGFLGRLHFASEELNDYIEFYNEHIGFDLHGERIGCGFEDIPSGKLILNVGVANINEELASLSINIRYPVTITGEDVIRGIQSKLEGTQIGLVGRMEQGPIYMSIDTPMVSKLLKAYQDETGDCETKAIVQGGGSYAKMVNNILAYGGMFPGEEDTMHQADEKMSIESFMRMARVYARALWSLCCE